MTSPAVSTSQDAIAIVGMGGVFPGARTLEEFWSLLERGVDTSKPVPSGRWILNPQTIHNPAPSTPDCVYTDRACFIEGFELNRAGLKLDSDLLESLDPSVHLLLEAGRNALLSAQMKAVDQCRIGIILGNIALPTTAISALSEELTGRAEARTTSPKKPTQNPLNRHVSGLPAGLLAQALGLGGGTCTLDAACASSLYAVKLACDELLAGRTDAMLAGGLSRPDSLYTQMGFCQLRALSRSGRCAPFDASGTGLIVGEGAGVVVLKRLSDALSQGDKILAVIRGVGLSNDLDGNLLSPSTEGQLRALHQAYQQAGWTPDQVDLIECHATGTPVGDAVEFESLSKLWQTTQGRPGQCVLGAVKANIGHLLTAAGSASLIKVLLALQHNTLPGTANFQTPSPKIPLAGSPFTVLKQSQPWPRRDATTPRRAAVNGFGFGGINAHLLIEEWLSNTSHQSPVSHSPAPNPQSIAIVGLAATVGPWTSLKSFQERVLGGKPAEKAENTDKKHPFPGFYLGDLAIPVNRYRIPPKELSELLPQQALMLEVARAALADAPEAHLAPSQTGVFIGLGLDLRTTDFHLRWSSLAKHAEQPAATPLTADRTMGALAGINASRIAKEFRFGGPSFTICSEDCSGLRALEIAVRALQKGEIDRALTGAVDLADARALLATDALHPFSRKGAARPFDVDADGTVPGEGAVALVLKRHEDAVRDGDRIYAVIRGIGKSSGDDQSALERAYSEAKVSPASVSYVEVTGTARPEDDRRELAGLNTFFASEQRKSTCALGSASADVGHTGAASGLVSLVKASLALYQEIIPGMTGLQNPLSEIANSKNFLAPLTSRFWLRNREEGPRRAGVSSKSVDGNRVHVVLEACESQSTDKVVKDRISPLGTRPEVLLVLKAEDQAQLLSQVESLREKALVKNGISIELLAREGFLQSTTSGPLSLALIAQDRQQLLRLLDSALTCVRNDSRPSSEAGQDRDRLFYFPKAEQLGGKIGFVFPGAGSFFADMGRELAVQWPEILRAQDQENKFLANQLCGDLFWNTLSGTEFLTDHRAVIYGQVSLGAMVSDLARSFGIRPEASIGYSLGESTSLFASHAWTDRDEMLHRVSTSPLFADWLTGKPEHLRAAWKLPKTAVVEWKTGLVDSSAEAVLKAIGKRKHVYILIINTPKECVLGGDAVEIDAVLAQLSCHWFPLQGVSTVHCELLLPFEKPYRAMHVFDTTPPAGLEFFTGGWGRAYVPDRDSAADAIVAQASGCIDFPRVIRAAYDSGVRCFLEMGPGNSCTRMIGKILEGKPHMARSLCDGSQEPVLGMFRVLAHLSALGVALDLSRLYSTTKAEAVQDKTPCVQIPIESPVFRRSLVPVVAPKSPVLPRASAPTSEACSPALRPSPSVMPHLPERPEGRTTSLRAATPPTTVPNADPFETEFIAALEQSQAATLSAHEAYLNFSQGLMSTLSKTVEDQLRMASGREVLMPLHGGASIPESRLQQPQNGSAGASPHRAPALDRAACLEFARGCVANVLGSQFAPLDAFPSRVRLPDEPLMLVDRILEIEGEACSMTHGRVVTEHDIHANSWYLDCGRIPTCIAVEAGQADLFLSGYLGIDFQTKGLAVYRLLDAKVCFHRGLPGPGEVIHYDIRIDHFFRQGNTWLFRFNFEATVNGRPLLTMTEGCAGFFSEEALASGKGVVRTTMDLKPMPGKRSTDWHDFATMGVESYSTEQLDALRSGDLVKCFGSQFAGLPLRKPATLPSGLMKLVHRIPLLDPTGGRFGLGLIRGEADIHPKDWFITCHFVDDRVMPGTLMFECCLHTLRVFLLRMGWVVEQDEAVFEPVPEIVSQLKCRGQVLETTKIVTYEVSIKEIGYRPEPYVIADALMYADGKPIVEITNMSLRYADLTQVRLREIWQAQTAPASYIKPAIYGPDRIIAYALGKPSEAFGAPYKIFDTERRIARLPGPPYMFLDRITEVRGEPFKMVSGAEAEAQYEIPANEWYFGENRQGDMPFAVLLEIALQPCGWLAAYVGSALASDIDVSFRNLGGKGTQFAPVLPTTGTLTIRVKLTRVSSSAGMIIQWFDLEVRSQSGVIYKGDTYFGFFPKAALAHQEGIKEAKLYQLSASESARAKALPYPTELPYVGTQLRMVDDIVSYIPDGGAQKLGFIRGTKKVNADEWFFTAHFYQDPVVPGSLGLESFLQLLKYMAVQRWGHVEGTQLEAVAINQAHEWVYRGQIIPTDHLVTIEATIVAVDDAKKLITAEGYLSVDGRIIYGMKNFTLQVVAR